MNKLFVWGGTDDLPSIDAECIATLAYLTHFGDVSNYEVLSGLDTSLSPNDEYPALSNSNGHCAGFSAIAHHIVAKHGENADIESWCSFVQQRGQALVDLYLYASSANYWEFTSPAFTKLLPWYLNYIIPPARRKAAVARTKHLGVRSLDLDSIDTYETDGKMNVGSGSTQSTSTFSEMTSPEAMLKKQKSIKWFQTQQHSDTFRLFELTKAFFQPLEELLVEEDYLLGQNSPTKLDCVATGYLSIIQSAAVPQPWLREALQTRYPKLDAYTTRMYDETFRNSDKTWKTRVSRMPSPTASQAANILSQRLLTLAFPASKQTIYSSEAESEQSASILGSKLTDLITPAYLLTLGAVAGLALGVAKYTSTSLEPSEMTFVAQETDFLAPTSLQNLGESGALLSEFGHQIDLETEYQRERTRTGGATMVAVNVENEQGEVGRDVVLQK